MRDKGLGIAADDLPRLFTRFGRLATPDNTNISGSGLGLYVSREPPDSTGATSVCRLGWEGAAHLHSGCRWQPQQLAPHSGTLARPDPQRSASKSELPPKRGALPSYPSGLGGSGLSPAANRASLAHIS